ncbi:MAG: CRTAC1 family protein [Sandaracinaceae bacterium]
MSRRAVAFVAALPSVLLVLAACDAPTDAIDAAGPPPPSPDLGAAPDAGRDSGPPDLGPPPPIPVRFLEVARDVGLTASQNARGPCYYQVLGGCNPTQFSGGVAVTDIDGDGRLDVYLTAVDGPGHLYRYDGAAYVDVTADYGLDTLTFRTNGAAFVDVDRDGDEDLYLTTHVVEGERTTPSDPARYLLLIREGDTFQEETLERGAMVESRGGAPARAGVSVAVGDYDLDGWPDLHVNEWLGEDMVWPPHTRLLRNRGEDGPGTYEDVTESSNALSVSSDCWVGAEPCQTVAFASGFTDFDNDGWPDLAIVKDFENSRLLWNHGDGTFRDGTVMAGGGTDETGMGSTFGDIDNDGDMDWFVTAIGNPWMLCGDKPCELGHSGNRLYRNNGDRTFTDITDQADVRHGGWGWGAVFFDYDNDTDLDLVMTNGIVYPRPGTGDEFADDLMRFWENDGTGRLEERSDDVNMTDRTSGKGIAVLDYDNDGDQDVLIVRNGDRPLLYENQRGNEAGSWLRVHVRGTVSLPDALGARVYVRIREGDDPIMREVNSAGHYLAQGERIVHVGLGRGVDRVAEVEVRWLSGRRLVLRDVEARQLLEVVEPDE